MKFRIPLFTLLLALSATFAPQQAKCWWDTGHMATALVAWDHMTEEAKTQCNELTAVLAQFWPECAEFSTISLWPDIIKGEGVYAFSHWHYTNTPNDPQGVFSGSQPNTDVKWAITQSVTTLTGRKVKSIMKAQFLAFLVHFVGDIHQPLHNSTLYSVEQPEGTRGGNNYHIKDDAHNNQLHGLWDDGCGLFPKLGMGEPVTQELKNQLQELADKAQMDHPKEDFLLLEIRNGYKANPNVDLWSRESYRLSVLAYQRLKEGNAPSKKYIKWGQEVVKERIAVGGYRLANLLNAIFAVDKRD